jgi:hypothetical protein
MLKFSPVKITIALIAGVVVSAFIVSLNDRKSRVLVATLPVESSHRNEANVSTFRCTATWVTQPEAAAGNGSGHCSSSEESCQPNSIRCQGTRGYALVLYALPTSTSNDDGNRNLNHFLRHGVYGANESTEMFERVDYVLHACDPSPPLV